MCDNLSETDRDLLFGGRSEDLIDQTVSTNTHLLSKGEELGKEISEMNKQKDVEISGLKVRIQELENKLGNLFKEFTFTSLDNIQKNWSLFDDQFQKLKDEEFKKQQQQLFASMTGGNSLSGLGLFGGVAAGGAQ